MDKDALLNMGVYLVYIILRVDIHLFLFVELLIATGELISEHE